ncbi:MAG: PAS domain S-box protein [Candidatus Sulfotelmatobacter sp.]
MEAQSESSTEEIKHLRRCINDLLSILTLPATWSGSTGPRIVGNLLDALVRMLSLDFVYAHLRDPTTGGSPAEMVRIRPAWEGKPLPEEIGKRLRAWLEDHPDEVSPPVRISFEQRDIALVLLQLGLHGDMGIIVAGSERLDFPQQTERLVLHVAANQAAIGLQESRLLSEERRNSSDLKQRVAQRTMELATINDELNKAHAQIIQSEERWRSVFENSAIGVALTDLNGRFIAANPVYQKMLGYTEEELGQLSFLDITVEEDRNLNWALIEELLEGKRRQFQIEKQYRRKNGSTVWVRNSVSVVPGTERVPRFIMALSEDLTEQHEAKVALDKARSDLTHVARISTLSALTASIAHEVNQPLSGIVTNASTCLRMLDANPSNLEGARETARRMIRDGNRASEVITRLRALFSKKSASFEPFDLNEAAKEVIALSVGELQRNRVIVQTDLASELPSVLGDRIQIQQVILNLIRNASEAMSAVDDRPRELLVETERDESGAVRLSIKDTGTGINPEIEEKLFEAFHTTKGDGMGIGLSVSRSITERHQGRLWAIRNKGPGATFIFSIPCSTNT